MISNCNELVNNIFMESQKQIVDTWVKLEKCLAEFDSEVNNRQKRPMSSAPVPNRFQITRKRPESSNMLGLPKGGQRNSKMKS